MVCGGWCTCGESGDWRVVSDECTEHTFKFGYDPVSAPALLTCGIHLL